MTGIDGAPGSGLSQMNKDAFNPADLRCLHPAPSHPHHVPFQRLTVATSDKGMYGELSGGIGGSGNGLCGGMESPPNNHVTVDHLDGAEAGQCRGLSWLLQWIHTDPTSSLPQTRPVKVSCSNKRITSAPSYCPPARKDGGLGSLCPSRSNPLPFPFERYIPMAYKDLAVFFIVFFILLNQCLAKSRVSGYKHLFLGND